ncbi:MAG: hypothetical protein JOZ15_21005 [Acidobacteria bacterium]|nr:hypothetical protein [Acidobacteriota bacterium]
MKTSRKTIDGSHAGEPMTRRDESPGGDPEAVQDSGDAVPVAADPRDSGLFEAPDRPPARGLGPEAGGQAGDTTGLSRDEIAGPESVEELVEEGQAYEASILDAVENAPDADQGEIRTREVPEDDVPQEYLDQEREP